MADLNAGAKAHLSNGESDRRYRDVLRKRMSRYLSGNFKRRWPLSTLLSEMVERGWTAYLFGGLPRDLMASRSRGYLGRPRDIDIVVEGITVERMLRVFSPYVRRRTRFGGVHLNINGWLFDVWPLGETWAFRERLVQKADFAHLPKTTFLDVEAIAYNPRRFYESQGVEPRFVSDGTDRQIYSAGFFEALRRRQVEINLRENPYPALCVVRALITAQRLGFSIGPKLAAYISNEAKRIAFSEFLSVQEAHYGRVILGSELLRKLIYEVDLHVQEHPDDEVGLSVMKPQLSFQMTDDAALSR